MTIENSPFSYAADWTNPVSAACIAAPIGVSEVGTAQPQPGGDALEEYAALFHRQAAGSGHNNLKLGIGQRQHDRVLCAPALDIATGRPLGGAPELVRAVFDVPLASGGG